MFCPLSCCTLTEQSRIKWEMACGSACVKKTVKVQQEEVIFHVCVTLPGRCAETLHVLCSLFRRYGPACQMLPRALHPPVHRLSAEHRAAERGLPMQLQRHLQQGNVPQLQEEPLQQDRLQREKSPHGPQHNDVPQDSWNDAFQR